jgi:cell division transport system ATP-binding protein
MPTQIPLIEVQNVSKVYNTIRALDSVSLSINSGEFVSLVGASGAGKSTLVKLLTLEERPSSGKILISGHDITKLRAHQIPYFRRRIGVVFQDFKLLPKKTVWENIAFAMEVSEKSNAQIRHVLPRVLETVGLTERANNFPDELSGGEKQRAVIARALINEPKIILADEPTGNLDPLNSWDIIQLLLRINQNGTTVILATHNREVVDALRRRVITLENGKLISDQKVGKYAL